MAADENAVAVLVATVATKADKAVTYTKTEVNDAIAVVSTEVATKASQTDLTTLTTTVGTKAAKTDLDALTTEVGTKAPQATTYTKSEINTELATLTTAVGTKAAKTDLDTLTTEVGTKALQATTFTKTEVTDALALKADQATTYNKTETDSRIQAVVGAAPAALDTLKEIADQLAADETAVSVLVTQVGTKADKNTTYTKTEVDTTQATQNTRLTDLETAVATPETIASVTGLQEALDAKASTIALTNQINTIKTDFITPLANRVTAIEVNNPLLIANSTMPIPANAKVGDQCLLLNKDNYNNMNAGLWIIRELDFTGIISFWYWMSVADPTKIVKLANGKSVVGVSLTPATLSGSPADTKQLTPVFDPVDAYDKTGTWSSLDTAIATVDSAGLVTFVGVGTTTVKFTSHDGGFVASATIDSVTASIPMSSFSLNKSVLNVQMSDVSDTLSVDAASILPPNASNTSVVWSSSDPAVATVDPSTGVVTYVSPGTAIITATSVLG